MELFIKNAHKFWENKERILTDRRMFFARVRMTNNLAYVNIPELQRATLGAYIQWWEECEQSRITSKIGLLDKKDNLKLVYHLAGSPLSGRNHCSAIDAKGKSFTVNLSPFSHAWKSFADIVKRYETERESVEPYTLEEVLSMLNSCTD